MNSENAVVLPVVVNKYKVDMSDPDIVYIGRGSVWGNPFTMKNESDRSRVIDEYRFHLYKQIRSGNCTVESLLSLRGKRIACFCAPKACHGDILVKAVEWANKNNLS